MALTDEEEKVIKNEVAALKSENARRRVETKDAEDVIATLTSEKGKLEKIVEKLTGDITASKEEVTKAKTEYDAKVVELENKSKETTKIGKLEVEALKQGMVDVDGLKLADITKITVDEKGNLVGTEDFFKTLKESKGYLFGKVNTTNVDKVPKPGESGPVDATKIEKSEDYEAAKQKLINS